jgi:hypothetical protein
MRTTAHIRVLPTNRGQFENIRTPRVPMAPWFTPIPVALRLDSNLRDARGGRLPVSRLIWIAARKPGGPIRTLETRIGLN